ncbi:MAG: hypothetical protein EXS13_05025 [Planctomycetes bacterium]|nr:hypothetical protein [Planctomycetota bacterium]
MNDAWRAARRLEIRLVESLGYLEGALAAGQGVTVACNPPPHYFPAKLLFFDDDLVAVLEEAERLALSMVSGPGDAAARGLTAALVDTLVDTLVAALTRGRDLRRSRTHLESREAVALFVVALARVTHALGALAMSLEEPRASGPN